MIRVLLIKDLCRARRNPLPWLVNLIVPLVMTALIGLAFGGHSEGGGLGVIRFAVVNEDKQFLNNALSAAGNERNGQKYLDPVFMARADALREVNAGKISAVLIIPTNFVANYLTAGAPMSLELIKNPAESVHPAVLEELLGALVTGLNAISRNFNSELPAWQAVFAGNGDYHQVSLLIDRAGNKLKNVRKFIDPPLVGYEKNEPDKGTNTVVATATTTKAAAGRPSTDNIFAFLLIGLSGMFLLFIAASAITDLHRELRIRTFERYQTLHEQLWPFIVAKVVFAMVVLLFCSAVMLGGGSLIFGFEWQHPLLLVPLALGYAGFVAALFATLVALVPDERRAGVLNNIASMALGLVGGCAFPPRQLPAFLREHITPLLPSYWFVDTLRTVECNNASAPWLLVSLKLAGLGVLLVGVATVLFRRRFKKGLRA